MFEAAAQLTYAEWNEYADMLAEAFAGRGLGFDDVIAVRCRNRLEWAVIALACSKIDARLLTIDPDLPPRALRERIIASRASAVIIGDSNPARLAPALDGLSLRLRATMEGNCPGFYDFWDLFPPVAPKRFGRAQPSVLAWSSGTIDGSPPVGLPRHRAAPASRSRPPLPENGASLITVPLHRVWGPVQFWAALAAGRSIALMRAFDPAAALAAIEQRRISHWSALPETFLELRRLGEETLRTANVSSLQDLVVGGAATPRPLKTWLADLFGPIVSEAYGATETGLIAVMPAGRHNEKPSSCGRPIKGASVEVRDAAGRRLPLNCVGEIWARTQRSIECDLPPSPQHRRDPEGFIATGDAGRLDDEGYLYITGRAADLAVEDTRLAG